MTTQLSLAEFYVWSTYIQELSGIVLDESKRYLIEGRLIPIMQEYKCQTFNEFYELSKSRLVVQEKIIDAISTHETFFFRNPAMYEVFRTVVKENLPTKAKEISVWSAACSTGQEIYSAAITLEEMPELTLIEKNLVGTDLSDSVLIQCKEGIYNNLEIGRGLSTEQISRYFSKEEQETSWKINPDLQKKCKFHKFNLITSYTDIGKFDVIFCCNVAIYFSPEKRKKMFKNVLSRLKPNGFLFLGLSERLDIKSDEFVLKERDGVLYYQYIPKA